MSKRTLNAVRFPPALLLLLLLVGCKDWEVVSVSPPTYPGNCQIGQDLFDEPQGSSIIPNWTGNVSKGDTCATVSVRLTRANQTKHHYYSGR